jgi:cobalt-zinc-cadmium efflux system protein
MHTHADGSHGSHHARAGSTPFVVGLSLNAIFVAAEVIFGVRVHSLALLADAGHNLGDVLGLGLAWGGLLLAGRPPSGRHTYGLRRASILAALANAILLLVAVGGILVEALRRLGHPVSVTPSVVMAVAALGIVVNGSSALLFLARRSEDLNLRAAFLHLATDTAVSFGVLVSAFAIARSGWMWLDPVVSLAISVVIVWSTRSLLMKALRLAMDAVPETVDLAAVEAYLARVPGVTAVHDLHVWGMSTTEIALTAHVVKPQPEADDTLLRQICRDLHERFRIEHATIQFEREDGPCRQAPADVV